MRCVDRPRSSSAADLRYLNGSAAPTALDAVFLWEARMRPSILTLALAGLAFVEPAAAATRCMVTDPTGTPLNVRRFDGKIIGVLHNGEIVRILRMGEDPQGKPWAYVAYETNGEGWVYREFISCY